MKKLLVLVAVAAVAYAVTAFVAWRLLSAKVEDANRRLVDVRIAIARLTKDQWIVSERLKTITNETLGRGKSKIDEVSVLLGDPDLNHLALTYMGSDWSLQHSSYLGQIAHARTLLSSQIEARKNSKSRLDEKIRELELRKRSLLKKMRTPSEERAWHVEMEDIDRQLLLFRSSNTYKQRIEKDAEDVKNIEVKARNEDSLFKLATEYETATVGALNKIMAEKLGDLHWVASEPDRLRRAGSFFNVWPLNLILKMPEGEPDEKRL